MDLPRSRRGRSRRDVVPCEDLAARAIPRLAEGNVREARPPQVAGHTYPYRHRRLGSALDELVTLRLSLVDVWLGHATDGPAAAARLLRDRGLEAAAVSAGGFYTRDSEPVGRAIELAEALAAPIIVACVAPGVLDAVAARIPPHITLCVENHWDQPLATALDVSNALTSHPDVAACLDTGHAILAGERPERSATTLGTRVRHVHLKDASFPPLRERVMGRRLRSRLLSRPGPVVPGRGALDVRRVRRALVQTGYTGAITVEYEGDDPTAAMALLLDQWASSAEPSAAQG